MMYWGYGMMGGWLGMMLFQLILIGLVIYVFVLAFNNNKKGNHQKGHDNSLEILNERFAKGEINEEEYKRKKELLINK